MYKVYENGKTFEFNKDKTLWENYLEYLNEDKNNKVDKIKSICNSLYKIDDHIKLNLHNEIEIDRLVLQLLDFNERYNKEYDTVMRKNIINKYGDEPIVLKLYNSNEEFCKLRKDFFDRGTSLDSQHKKIVNELLCKIADIKDDKTLMIQFLSENKNLRYQISDNDFSSTEKITILKGVLDRILENKSSVVILIEEKDTYTITGFTTSNYKYSPMSLDELKSLKCSIPSTNQHLDLINVRLKEFAGNKEIMI